MIVSMPAANSGMANILDSIKRIFLPVVSQNEAVARIILLSPNGTSYEVTVADDGTLVTTALAPGSFLVTHGKAHPR